MEGFFFFFLAELSLHGDCGWTDREAFQVFRSSERPREVGFGSKPFISYRVVKNI